MADATLPIVSIQQSILSWSNYIESYNSQCVKTSVTKNI